MRFRPVSASDEKSSWARRTTRARDVVQEVSQCAPALPSPSPSFCYHYGLKRQPLTPSRHAGQRVRLSAQRLYGCINACACMPRLYHPSSLTQADRDSEYTRLCPICMDKTVYTVLGMYIQYIRSIPAGSIETLSWMEWCFTGLSTGIDACLKQP